MLTDDSTIRQHLALLAPGTALREGIERILKGRTGALLVLGHNRVVEQLSTGGFLLDVPYTPQTLRELAKMDGAIILNAEADRIIRAAVHLVPDASIDTPETGTRHRTADRVAKQAGVGAISVSASMSTISLFLDRQRHVVDQSSQILTRANLALQTLESYRDRLAQLTSRLSAMEVEDQVSLRDLALVAQRLEMVRRLEHELFEYVLELGTDGRLLDLQLRELNAGVEELSALIEMDYDPIADSDGFTTLRQLHTEDLLDPILVARSIGFGSTDHLETRVTPRGIRQLSQIPRLPQSLAPRLLEHFGSLQALFAASATDLQDVEGVGDSRAKTIREGLTRLAESAFHERLN